MGARGLLEMTQSDLAAAVGLSEKALSYIESGKAIPRRNTLEKIRIALELRGIEFINGTGVKLKTAAAEHEGAAD